MSTAGVGREATVSMRVLRALVDAVQQAGVPRAELLRAAGVRTEQLGAADARLPRFEIDRICALAIELTGDSALGLHWAEGLSDRAFGPVSEVLAYSASLRHGLELLLRFERLISDEPFFELLDSGDAVMLRILGLAEGSPVIHRFSAEVAAVGLSKLIRSFSDRAALDAVSFEYSAPAYQGEYARIFGHAVHFERPFTGIVLGRARLDAPSPNEDEDMQAALSAVAERRLLTLAQQAPYALRVRAFLVEHAPARFSMSDVASSLGLSVRSLRRRLAAEGKSYCEVEYDALAFVAKMHLRDEQCTIQETAYQMGFSDATTFHRAFKRWTGTTPGAFQGQLRKV